MAEPWEGWYGPQQICQTPGCSRLVPLKGLRPEHYTLCQPCEADVLVGQGPTSSAMKLQLMHAARRRSARVGRLVSALGLPTMVLNLVKKFLEWDLGSLLPSHKWMCLLEYSGYSFHHRQLQLAFPHAEVYDNWRAPRSTS